MDKVLRDWRATADEGYVPAQCMLGFAFEATVQHIVTRNLYNGSNVRWRRERDSTVCYGQQICARSRRSAER